MRVTVTVSMDMLAATESNVSQDGAFRTSAVRPPGGRKDKPQGAEAGWYIGESNQGLAQVFPK